jgi:signal transduction histidine kinase
MKPVITLQMVARAILWSLLFSFEVAVLEVIKAVPQDYHYYVAAIVMTDLLFLMTFRLGESALVRDMRELCFYDFLVQCTGLVMYIFKDPTMVVFIALCYIVITLKFLRLLWMCRTADGSAFVSWPVFGLIGLSAKARGQDTASGASSRQDLLAYTSMMATIIVISIIYVVGFTMPQLAYLAPISICLIVWFYQPAMTFLEDQYARQIAAEKALAFAEAKAAYATELETKNAELAEANRQRDLLVTDLARRNEVLRDASHDLAAPLSWIEFCSTQQALAQDPATRLALSQQLHDATAHYSGLLNDTIHNAKITTMLEAPKIRAIYVNDVVDGLWNQYLMRFKAKGVRFNFYKANQWLAAADGTMVNEVIEERRAFKFSLAADEHILTRILNNLIMNAMRHTTAGHVRVAFRKRPNNTCWIEVRDTGEGIPGANGPDWAANFAAVARNIKGGRMKSREAASHGLGINNVKNLCATIGATMQLYSQVGRGSIFRFVVPLADEKLISATVAEKAADMAALGSGFVY